MGELLEISGDIIRASWELIFQVFYPAIFWDLFFGGIIIGIILFAAVYFLLARAGKGSGWQVASLVGIITVIVILGLPMLYILFGILLAAIVFIFGLLFYLPKGW